MYPNSIQYSCNWTHPNFNRERYIVRIINILEFCNNSNTFIKLDLKDGLRNLQTGRPINYYKTFEVFKKSVKQNINTRKLGVKSIKRIYPCIVRYMIKDPIYTEN